jgi:hypothetical protein
MGENADMKLPDRKPFFCQALRDTVKPTNRRRLARQLGVAAPQRTGVAGRF